MRMLRLIVGLLAVAGCVDSGTGTGTGGDTSGVSNTDPSGNWNATQYTFTSKTDATATADYIQLGYSVSLTISTGGAVTLSVTKPVGSEGASGRISVVGDSLIWKKADSTLYASGKFSRNNNQMTIDLSGPGIKYDFNKDGADDLALLHANLVQIAH